MNKVALLCYHKNLSTIYPQEWVDEYRDSILGQSFKDFDVYEINYGGGDERIFVGDKFAYMSKEFPTFVYALNYLLDHVFSLGYDYVWNTNADDYYSPQWIEKQLKYMEMGYDLVSANFALVSNGEIVHRHRFHNMDIPEELKKGHNPICHPAVSYSKEFWKTNRYIPEELPYEDMKLWWRAIKNGAKAIILEDCLCYHRLHVNSVCQSENR